jgi:hypothetical protein
MSGLQPYIFIWCHLNSYKSTSYCQFFSSTPVDRKVKQRYETDKLKESMYHKNDVSYLRHRS